MRIAVIGGGPGGLYFAALTKALDPTHEITVWERNAPDDTFGFGVVFSDETLGGIEHADPWVFQMMEREFARWDDIDVHVDGQVLTSGGHGFAAMSRKRLLEILQQRCRELEITLHFRTEAPDVETLAADYDLVLASDGLNSAVRRRYADTFRPTVDERQCKYMWLGTSKVFEAFKFYILDTPHGVMQVHGYPFDATGSTFILEMHEDVWRAAGFDASEGREWAPGESDEEAIKRVRELCSDIFEGHEVMANNSRWISFATIRNETWRAGERGNIVILGDSAHTAHFSIGSGTKLAMEDSLALAACLHEHPDLDTALSAYEEERKPVVQSTQRAAQASLEWFENLGQYRGQDPEQFAFNIMTRSRRVTHDNLKVRDPEFAARIEEWFTAATPGGRPDTPPMFQPFRLGELELTNRVVVSPMDMYVSTDDGMPTDFRMIHLGGKAMGGAGLVMTEMVCVSPEGRITPGCAGIWSQEQADGWRHIVEAVHGLSAAKIGLQVGHSGRKGSTKLMWDGIDEPLEGGNWPVMAPSPLAYQPGVNQVPREMSEEDLSQVKQEFVTAARLGAEAGFDVLEMHAGHGYLLSSFISPVTNQRTDAYGGDLAGRLRYPLEVFEAMREVWPTGRPMTVRISATDWVEGGIDVDDAVEIARAFQEAGAAAIDVSTGQVTPDETPAFGRSYQTPFADAIRNRVGIPTIAVGIISSWDDVNSIVLAGRADLCAVGRAHLYDPNWTLHAAVEQDYDGPGAIWPLPWRAGRRKPQGGRSEEPKPRLQLVREGAQGTRHARWRPEA
ncbi:bifunctional salicylyl-CoA 5-hydroxylase/oxidoreductase [Ornithinimicrobium faecis]|uniref:Bifunctional salicylyl-CoA 5-hydroxylase/oxidoreductase n=1 Tax=Ornithinimicrobium faecis TaxID=2934158 RepID=A0ABY4YRQ0_9MICO|nr:bifunctional salicylyl-CoA 5-hydroxylase/oxidoreductase [Ornithinimicrobium sp. HY1793]USQ78965.1 bifunctional salicylyl-CoA 5-hydroxylase/oxidoreductase [Ornithinimicrobium sp. HY1793]